MWNEQFQLVNLCISSTVQAIQFGQFRRRYCGDIQSFLAEQHIHAKKCYPCSILKPNGARFQLSISPLFYYSTTDSHFAKF